MDSKENTSEIYKNHKLEDLTPEEFEKYCLQIANDWAKQNIKVGEYSIHYRKRNPIDIVINERNTEISLPGQIIAQNSKEYKEHFIECKFYSRNLDLDVLGKSYIMTLRYRPKTLVIATNSDLSQSAIDFASWLSDQIKDFACLLWNPDNSKRLNKGSSNNLSKEIPYQDKYTRPYIINNWSLVEDDVFTSILLSTNADSSQKSHFIKSNYKYFFKGNIKSILKYRETKRVRLILEFEGERNPTECEMNFKENIGGVVTLICELPILSIEKLVIKNAYLSITSSSGEDIINVKNFPRLITDPILSCKLNDFRSGEAEDFYLWWILKDTPILIITGNGGVGKSFLCEKICQRFKEDGTRIVYAAISHESQATFITDILWVILPNDIRTLIQDKSDLVFKSDFISAFLEVELQDFRHEVEEVRNLFLYNKWDNVNIESIISILLRLLSKSNHKVVLYVSDCHRLPTSISSVLMSIMAVLESRNWLHDKFRIILEYRDEDNEMTLNCKRLINWIDLNLSTKVTEKKIEPLTYEQLKNYLDKTLISSDNSAACKQLLNKSGGNSLYLRMLILSMLEHSILEYVDGGNLHLFSLTKLRDFVVKLTPSIHSILIKRLDFANTKLIERGISNGIFIIVYNALSGLNISNRLIAILCQQDELCIHEGMLHLQEMELIKRNQTGTFDWSHEYIYEATKKWASIQDNYFVKIDRATKLITITDFVSSFLLAKLERILSRDDKAIEALNAAIQFSQQIFTKKYLCHFEILQILNDRELTPKYGALFLTNLEKLSHLSGYLISSTQVEEYNILGVKALGKIQYMTMYEKKPFYRQYYHNLAHISLSKMDFLDYSKYCVLSLKYCNIPVEYAQLLNRMVIYFRLTGNFAYGRKAASIALQLQQFIENNEDLDLESVIIGEIARLYWTASPDTASKSSDYLQNCPASSRQSSHNLYIKACQELLSGDLLESKETKARLDETVKKLDLKSMASSINNLTGIYQALAKDYDSAHENFRTAFQNAIWLDSIQEELVFGNNLLLAMILSSQLYDLDVLANRLLLICNKILKNDAKVDVENLLDRLELLLENKFQIPKLNSIYHELLSDSKQSSNHLCYEVLLNLIKVSEITRIQLPQKSGSFDLTKILEQKTNGVYIEYNTKQLKLLI
jgi:hypothetical protein